MFGHHYLSKLQIIYICSYSSCRPSQSTHVHNNELNKKLTMLYTIKSVIFTSRQTVLVGRLNIMNHEYYASYFCIVIQINQNCSLESIYAKRRKNNNGWDFEQWRHLIHLKNSVLNKELGSVRLTSYSFPHSVFIMAWFCFYAWIASGASWLLGQIAIADVTKYRTAPPHAPRWNTCLGFNWINRKCGGNV